MCNTLGGSLYSVVHVNLDIGGVAEQILNATSNDISVTNKFLQCHPKWILEFTIKNCVFSSVTRVVIIQVRRIRGSLPPIKVVPEALMSCKSLRLMKREVFRTFSQSSPQIWQDSKRPSHIVSATSPVGSSSKQNVTLSRPFSSSQFYSGH